MSESDERELEETSKSSKLKLENDILRLELQLKEKELELKLKEFEEQDKKKDSWWRNANPLVVAIIAALIGFLGNSFVTYLQGWNNLVLEREKLSSSLQIENEERQTSLILKAIETGDQETAAKNLVFFINVGFLQDPEGKILAFASNLENTEDIPVLPVQSNIDPEVAKLQRLMDERSYSFQILSDMIDNYNETSREIIDSITK